MTAAFAAQQLLHSRRQRLLLRRGSLFRVAAFFLVLLAGLPGGRGDVASVTIGSDGSLAETPTTKSGDGAAAKKVSDNAGAPGADTTAADDDDAEADQRHLDEQRRQRREQDATYYHQVPSAGGGRRRRRLDLEVSHRRLLSEEGKRQGREGWRIRSSSGNENDDAKRGKEEGEEDRQQEERELQQQQRERRLQLLLRDKIEQIEVGERDDEGEDDTTTNTADEVAEEEEGGDQKVEQQQPNLLFIVSDQLRFDAVRYAQDRLAIYSDKLKVETPNIDKLAAMGVNFETAYCVSPSCAPARATFRTGNSLTRAAIKGNKMVNGEVYKRMRFIEDAVAELETFEQVLVEEKGYAAETYGKWHVPLPLYYARPTVFGSASGERKRVIDWNDYNFETSTPQFEALQHFKPFYQRSVSYLLKRDNVNVSYQEGQQKNYFSMFPYTPIGLDARFGYRTNTPLKESSGFERWQMGNSNVCGRDSLGVNHTSTAVLGQMALKSLDRLMLGEKPWSLSVHFNAPHPPMVATSHFLDKYWNDRSNLLVSPSIDDNMRDSAYSKENGRKRVREESYGNNNPNKMAELTAVYYAMIEELDFWVGELVQKVERAGLAKNTLIIFTADHGEMLGSHGMLGKGILLEESVRVPLVMRYDGVIPSGLTIQEPASHMDIFASILDYTGASQHDRSDGRSLRRYIDRTYFNQNYDDRVVVSEMDKRVPISNQEFSRTLGDEPNLMIRKGDYVLIIPKKADSEVIDMMYNLRRDPFQMTNLLRDGGSEVTDKIIAKAEHLKVLLVEWLRRMDGSKSYYSSKMYNNYEGNGDIAEVRWRRTWRALDYWVSDEELSFGSPSVLSDGTNVRNEFLYIGRTSTGSLVVTNVAVFGDDAGYFELGDTRSATIEENGYLRIKVAFRSSQPVEMTSLQATILIQLQGLDNVRIPIVGEAPANY